ncbi:MAG: sulfurtransferase TusA family protein [Thermotogae bacterium]|nr:sulfurtransferase TusA family protein [Thermotogota bacterium]
MLEEMRKGEVLGILLDEGGPIRNVPRSLKEEGHEILHVEDWEGFTDYL